MKVSLKFKMSKVVHATVELGDKTKRRLSRTLFRQRLNVGCDFIGVSNGVMFVLPLRGNASMIFFCELSSSVKDNCRDELH